MNKITFLIIIGLCYFKITAQLTENQEILTNKIEFSTNDYSATLSGAKTNYSSVITFHGTIYFVYCDSNRRPIIGQINTDGVINTVYLDKDEVDIYQVNDDDHHTFSIGVDKKGYLHVTGDAHANFYNAYPDLLPERYQDTSYLHWVSETPENINSFEFISLHEERIIPGFAFTYISFHNDMNGTLFAQYRSRVHHVSLPPGANGWCIARYNATNRAWKVLGDVPESTNAKGVYPAVIWEQAGHYYEADPSLSFYQGFMSDLNFDFNNRMHIAATINANATVVNDTHVIYSYSDDLGESFKKPNNETIEKLPIRPIEGEQQGEIVDSIENNLFDGIYRNASVVFNKEGIPAVSFLTLNDKNQVSTEDRDHYRYWIPSEEAWSNLLKAPQNSQAGSEHLLDCNGVITFGGSRVWNAQMYRTKAFGEEGYTTYALPDESSTINMSGPDERALKEENVIRRMITNDDTLMIVSSKFKPVSLEPIEDEWRKEEIGYISEGEIGYFNDILKIEASGEGLLSDGTLDLQYINTVLDGDGGVQVRVINIDYHIGAFAGLMLSAEIDDVTNFYAITIDYNGLRTWINTGNGGNIHIKGDDANEPSEWLKLDRSGETIKAYYSNNGIDWKLFSSVEISLPNEIKVGVISGSGGDGLGITRLDNLETYKNSSSLSITEEMLNNGVKIYPNPSNTFINIEHSLSNKIEELSIYDVTGAFIKTYSKINLGKNTIEIDISSLKKGVYFIKVADTTWSKFVKK